MDLPSDFPPELYVFGSFNVVRFDFSPFLHTLCTCAIMIFIVTLNKAILSTSDIYQKPEHHMASCPKKPHETRQVLRVSRVREKVVRAPRFEPGSSAWQADVLDQIFHDLKVGHQ